MDSNINKEVSKIIEFLSSLNSDEQEMFLEFLEFIKYEKLKIKNRIEKNKK